MTEITPELKALADAALAYEGGLVSGHDGISGLRDDLLRATEAYRATQAPKECRPPDGAKRGDLFWLARSDGMKIPAGWMENDTGFYWDAVGHGNIIPSLAGANGWTCHSECRFGETGVSVTCEEIDQFLKSRGVELLNTTLFHLTEFIEQVRAPKLEISDEEILDVAGQHTDWPTGAPSGGLLASQLTQIVRAVIAKVGGEK